MINPEIQRELRTLWNDIEQWYNKNAPRLSKDLKKGASDQQISDAETHLGIALPDDYKASLKIHNGEVYLNDYSYLSLDTMLHKWSMMTELAEDGTFKEREIEDEGGEVIQNTWWHRNWIPFAEDSGGNLLSIDMAPAIKGTKGQVLYMEQQTGPIASEYKSFLEWLRHYRDDLGRGVYEVDDDGYLTEKYD